MNQNKEVIRTNYDKLARRYIRNYVHPTSLFALEKKRRLSILQYYLNNIRPKSILDLGCGPGYVAAQVSNCLSKSVVTGIDFSSEMIQVAQQNFAEKSLFLQGDAENLPFENNQFSAVYALGVLEKFNNPLIAIRECHRVLMPGGHFFFTYPNRYSFLRRFRRMVIFFSGKNIDVLDNNVFLIDNMRSIVDQIGFNVLEITYLTYGNSFILFPWTEKINLFMEVHFGKGFIGRTIAMTSFWSLQKNISTL